VSNDDAGLFVTSNLHSALRQLSQNGNVRFLWADAICINQKDVPERGYQVTIMRHIYERADETIVWLGETADDSKLAFLLIREWANASKDFEEFLRQFPFAFDERRWQAVLKLANRP